MKVSLDIQMAATEDMMKEGMAAINPNSEEGQRKMMMKMMV